MVARAQGSPDEYLGRGEEEFMAGNFKSALTDYSLYCTVAPKDPDEDYVRIFLWLTRAQLNQKGEADQELSEAMEKEWNAAPEAWVSKIAGFFLEQVDEKDLLSAASVPGGEETANQQFCEAWYYAGMKRLLAGDKTTAISYFRKSMATQEKDFTEYIFSQAQLKALGVAE
jgi:lipoprotein NlpI